MTRLRTQIGSALRRLVRAARQQNEADPLYVRLGQRTLQVLEAAPVPEALRPMLNRLAALVGGGPVVGTSRPEERVPPPSETGPARVSVREVPTPRTAGRKTKATATERHASGEAPTVPTAVAATPKPRARSAASTSAETAAKAVQPRSGGTTGAVRTKARASKQKAKERGRSDKREASAAESTGAAGPKRSKSAKSEKTAGRRKTAKGGKSTRSRKQRQPATRTPKAAARKPAGTSAKKVDNRPATKQTDPSHGGGRGE